MHAQNYLWLTNRKSCWCIYEVNIDYCFRSCLFSRNYEIKSCGRFTPCVWNNQGTNFGFVSLYVCLWLNLSLQITINSLLDKAFLFGLCVSVIVKHFLMSSRSLTLTLWPLMTLAGCMMLQTNLVCVRIETEFGADVTSVYNVMDPKTFFIDIRVRIYCILLTFMIFVWHQCKLCWPIVSISGSPFVSARFNRRHTCSQKHSCFMNNYHNRIMDSPVLPVIGSRCYNSSLRFGLSFDNLMFLIFKKCIRLW